MRENRITIDMGTTNTRIVLWGKGQQKRGEIIYRIGAKRCAEEGNNREICDALRNGFTELFSQTGECWEQVKMVIGCGMLTSELGLVQIPHISSPAGICELAQSVRMVNIPDICPLPFYLIPGIQTAKETITVDNYDKYDIMRGEETETVAILKQFGLSGPVLLFLTGSHDKIIFVDRNGRISHSITSMTGELLEAVTFHTILSDATGNAFVTSEEYEEDMVMKGYLDGKRFGTGRSCFYGRILKECADINRIKICNYLLGVMLQNDIKAVENETAGFRDAVIAGKGAVGNALYMILKKERIFEKVMHFEDCKGESFSSVGALMIADYLIQNG